MQHHTRVLPLFLALALGALACSPETDPTDAGPIAPDAGSTDTPDAGSTDAPDAGSTDTPDAGSTDTPDAGSTDTPDAGGTDTPDAGSTDAPDAGSTDTPDAGSTDTPDAGSTDTPDAGMALASPGCGQTSPYGPGVHQERVMFTAAAGGARGFHLVIPDGYDASVPHRLVVGYAGTNWLGAQIRGYLNLEQGGTNEIYVYPDLKWRDFPGWGNLGGWVLGPHASPADGWEDIEFTRELVAHLADTHCIDQDRVFATGHSWGGDMAAVAGCFLGDVFTAVAPAAANRPYWFEPRRPGPVGCQGEAAVWTFFGQNETHFTWQSRPGQFGDEQHAYWTAKHGCSDAHTTVTVGADTCEVASGCSSDTRYCFYGPATGHQIPPGFSAAVRGWFRSF